MKPEDTHSVDVKYITVQDDSKSKLLEDRLAKLMSEMELNKNTMRELEQTLEEERKKKIEMEKNR